MSEPFIGEIRMFAGNYPPKGWAACDGQLLQVHENQALFSIIGAIYGGDGRTNFALPDLKGRFPMHTSPTYPQGNARGQESVTLVEAQMPSHSHSSAAYVASTVDDQDPTGKYCGKDTGRSALSIYSNSKTDAKMAENEVASAGGNQAHDNMPPYLPIYFIIALQGIFPSRN